MIRAGTAADHPALIALWQTCFGDSESLIRTFLQRVGHDTHVRVAEEDGQIIAAAYLIDAQLCGEEPVPVWYEYALGTLPHARGRGVMARLLAHVRAEACERNIPYTALVPADAHLAAYYEKLNYRPFFSVRTFSCDRAFLSEATALPQTHMPITSPAALRSALMQTWAGSLQWSDFAVDFALSFAKQGGAQVATVPNGYAVWTENNGVAHISEWLCTPCALSNLCGAFLAQSTCTQLQFRLPPNSSIFSGKGNIQPFGMLRCTGLRPFPQATHAYLGLEMN